MNPGGRTTTHSSRHANEQTIFTTYQVKLILGPLRVVDGRVIAVMAQMASGHEAIAP